ncbi:hypothetical protein Vadar_007315 [Vaccinium darrowii]|uniref:Uncharacterized protein n=1 Tax=Vaccinium darrowii TaxID=229202 RepID=A0ACB7XFV8_9ERIC|nr:hypothetical protein Vadar_007315 [Vaccinium darrowii]
MLLSSLPGSLDNLVTTLLWGKETLELEEVTATLLAYNQRRLQTESVQGEGLVVKGYEERGRRLERGKLVECGRSKSKAGFELKCYKSHEPGHFKKNCPQKGKGGNWKKKQGKAGDRKDGPSNSANVVERDDSEDGVQKSELGESRKQRVIQIELGDSDIGGDTNIGGDTGDSQPKEQLDQQ